MLSFIKDSIRELRHVVWPTRKETQKFFWFVLFLIIIFTIYLFLFSHLFSHILFSLEKVFSPSSSTQVGTPDFDIWNIFIDEHTDENDIFQDSENWIDIESQEFIDVVWWDEELNLDWEQEFIQD